MKKFLLIFIALILLNYSSKSQSNWTREEVAKITVQRIFKFSLNDEIDSLKVVAPSIILQGSGKDAIKIKFKPFKDIASEKGIPAAADFQLQKKIKIR